MTTGRFHRMNAAVRKRYHSPIPPAIYTYEKITKALAAGTIHFARAAHSSDLFNLKKDSYG
jgi:hypothetical protein